MAVIGKKYWTAFQFQHRPLIGAKKSLGWSKHDNFAFYMPGYGILVNDTPITGNRTYQHKCKLLCQTQE